MMPNVKHVILLAAASVAALGGCQAVQPPKSSQLSQHTITEDGAMRMRDWPQVSARYEDMNLVAGHGGQMWEYNPEMQRREGWARALDVPMFLLNTVTLPFSIFYDQPIWRPYNSRTAAAETSYHGMPVLPPSPTAASEVPADPAAPSEPAEPMDPAPMPSDPAEPRQAAPDPVDPPPAQPAPSEPSTRPNN